MRRLILLAALSCAGCFDFAPASGTIKCSSDSAHPCPDGYECVQGACWRPADVDLSSVPDMPAPPDLAGDMATGDLSSTSTKHQGDQCTADNQCDTGHCVDNVCCDKTCTGQCQACDVGAGICSTITGTPHGTRPACSGGTGVCANTCNGASTSCAFPDATTSCGAQTCSGAPPTLMSASACNGQGACVPTGGTSMQCPAPFGGTATCNGNQCDFTCGAPYQKQGSSCLAVFNPDTVNTGGASVDFYTVWGSSSTNVYAGGNDTTNSKGAIYRTGVGGTWSGLTLPNGAPPISGLWGDNGQDIYASGAAFGDIYHSADGSSFPQAIQTGIFDGYFGAWGSGVFQDVWIVGHTSSTTPGAIVERHSGGSYAAETTGLTGSVTLTAVWGSGDTDVYAVADTGTIIHTTGNGSWGSPQQFSHTMSALYGIWGADATHIWAVGAAGTIIFTTGNGQWSAQTSGTSKDLRGIWGSSGGDIYAVGLTGTILHSTGDGKWAPQTSNTTTTLRGVWGTGPTNVWAVGDGTTIVHFH